jgi:predicted Zn-dependent peptidase
LRQVATGCAGGLRVLALEMPHLQRATLALYTRVGSRFESQALNGVSHFLEHMLYRGTKTLPNAHAVNRAFERLGGSLYAATHVDYGVFSVSAPAASIEPMVPLLADVLTAPTFRDIDVERGIVVEEILEDLDDEGRDVDADNGSRRLIYDDHPLGFTITGTEAQVRAFTEQDLHTHHQAHYAAANSVLVMAGAFPAEEALRWAAPFAAMAHGERRAGTAPVHAQREPRFGLIPNASSQVELRVSFRAIAERLETRAPMELLLRVLDDGMSTRLYHRICDELGLCYDVSANFDGYEDDGVFDFAASVNPERSARVVSEITRLLADIAEHGPTTEELDEAKQRATWQLEGLLDAPEELAATHALPILFDRAETPEQHHARLMAVTREDIRVLAARIAQPECLNVVAVGNPVGKERTKLEKVVRDYVG